MKKLSTNPYLGKFLISDTPRFRQANGLRTSEALVGTAEVPTRCGSLFVKIRGKMDHISGTARLHKKRKNTPKGC